MFVVDIDKESNLIQIKVNNNTNSDILIAEGKFIIDEPDRTVLILLNRLSIAPDDYEQLSQFLSIVTSTFGELYKSLIRLRLPNMFDNQIDGNKMKFKNNHFNFMAAKIDDLKYDPENDLANKQEQYELITDKQSILHYAETLITMMTMNGFWCKKWNLQEMKDRINSATYNAMILDKKDNSPCGFGRIFLLKTNDEIFGYLSDIVVDFCHQSKGLGRIIVNYLVGMSANNNYQQQNISGTLCLECADQGAGAISAPKLYQRLGFDYINNIGNRIAVFANNQYYV